MNRPTHRTITRTAGAAALLVALAFITGCLGSRGGMTGPVVRPMLSPDIIRAEDKLVITFNDLPTPVIHEITVPESGDISLHLNQSFNVKGRTISELQHAIKTNYVPRFYLALTPAVKIQERFFFVQGEVRKADRYLYSSDMTVLKAIATAGGFTDFADRTEVQLTLFNGQKLTIDCKAAQKNPALDLKVLPGESINVPRRF